MKVLNGHAKQKLAIQNSGKGKIPFKGEEREKIKTLLDKPSLREFILSRRIIINSTVTSVC